MLKQLVLSFLVAGAAGAGPLNADAVHLVDSLFQDHMVFQRDAPVRIWGSVQPGEVVSLEMSGQTTSRTTEVTADEAGAWSASLPALPVGGPYELAIRTSGGASHTLADVLVGDVFLCSGQSNMEMPVVRGLNSWSEVNRASNDRIRMTKVGRSSTAAPKASFPEPLVWQSASPETVGDWSAVCYYFARELQKTVDVPMGLIDASWGGSDVRAWMDAESLGKVGGYGEMLELLRLYAEDEAAAQRHFGAAWESWWREEAGSEAAGDEAEPWQPASGTDWSPAPETLGDWKQWGMSELESFDGMVWYRATAELSAEQADQDATLVLGGVDEVDQTWFGGRVVANTFGWGDVRRYELPAEWLHAGENVVVTNIYSAWDYGGLIGDEVREIRFADGTGVPLGDWRYQKVEAPREPPRAPWESIAGRTTIHNAMIAPLRNLELRGALWYQGESNTAQGLGYAPLLEGMIGGWREQFQVELPFLVVQLAGFGSRSTEPTESGLADVREAQRLVARDDPRTALVTAVDVGDVYDVHPPNKQEVGRRLARAARYLIYGDDVTPSGPVPRQVTREGGAVRVEFDDVVGGLLTYGHERPVGFQLCGEAPESCRWADARFEPGAGSVVVLEGLADATRVRYCWGDSPVCTLYDGAGLPAIPFELRIDETIP